MGQYDNYDNAAGIKAAQKKLRALRRKRKPDRYAIAQAEREFETQLKFSSCQAFGHVTGFRRSEGDPNEKILFSDDWQLLSFGGQIIPYGELAQCGIFENTRVKTSTQYVNGKPWARALIGNELAGSAGAFLGAVTAQQAVTERTVRDGFVLQIVLHSGEGWQMAFAGAGLFSNKIPEQWALLLQKLNEIIEQNHCTAPRQPRGCGTTT